MVCRDRYVLKIQQDKNWIRETLFMTSNIIYVYLIDLYLVYFHERNEWDPFFLRDL